MENKWENQVIQGDSLELIPQLPNDFIDLVVTSPPYNVNLGDNKFNKSKYDTYDDNKNHWKYIEWLRSLFVALNPKIKSGGRVCINIGDGKNGQIPTHSDIIQFMMHGEGLKYLIKTTIIWNKSQIGNRTSWGSFKSPSNPSFPTPFEYVMVFCKDSQEKAGAKEDITITKKEFITNSLALWNLMPEIRMKRFKHPAMFPLELPYRLIQSLSYKGDLVFDPFSGVGTTCLAAKISGRRYLGFELSEEYIQTARGRLDAQLGLFEVE